MLSVSATQLGNIDLVGIEDFLQCDTHALVLGGPGSGKTTAALVKANQEVSKSNWKPYQQVLFLSFARSTVARVAEAAASLVEKGVRNQVELTTYHSFTWRLIRSHGYLIQKQPCIRLLPPHQATSFLVTAAKDAEGEKEKKKCKDAERKRLLEEEGLLDFDLFAAFAADILEQSPTICRMVSSRYPLIFLDEFQDTNSSEWRCIQCLANNSRIISLADPDQRIYGFRGADPKRIQEFTTHCDASTFDFAERNHRSNGTDILAFANDLLSQKHRTNSYNDVKIKTFPTRKADVQHFWMKTEVLASIKRLKKSQTLWSVALLVPTKKLMLAVSEYLSSLQEFEDGRTLPKINHDVAVDAGGPALAGVAIGRLLACPMVRSQEGKLGLLADLCNHMIGRKSGKNLSQTEQSLVDAFQKYILEGTVRGSRRKRIIDDCARIANEVAAFEFTGDPYLDWILVRDCIASSAETELKLLAYDSRFLKLLRKGASLRQKLASLWKSQGSYLGAREAVENAFVQEHFVASNSEPRGIHVMTIHKSKGKEFDEIIVYEGIYADRIVRKPDEEDSVAQSRLNLRVAVSRGKKRVTILTPQHAPCELL